jgi:hypothetical protein
MERLRYFVAHEITWTGFGSGVGVSLLANPAASCKVPTLGTVRTNREQARSYRHRPVNSYVFFGSVIGVL